MSLAPHLARALLGTIEAVDGVLGWPYTEPSARWFRTLNGRSRRCLSRAVFRLLARENRTSAASLLGFGPPVSMTSYGRRISTAFAAIESIGLGATKPSRLVLWLDSERDLENLDHRLAQLRNRGLEVRLSENFGPHTKYWPFVRDLWDGHSQLVTADDDIIYPPGWLSRLVAGSSRTPQNVVGHRAHIVAVDGVAIAPYVEWPPATSTKAGPQVFATGVSGVLYPSAFLAALKERGPEFQKVAPKADDVWLHFVEVVTGHFARQVRARSRHYMVVGGSQVTKLQDLNVSGAGNDQQVAATYSREAIQTIVGADRDA